MKLISHSRIVAALAGVLIATAVARGEDKNADNQQASRPAITLPADVTAALEKAGVDAKTIEQIQSSIKGASGASVSAIMIGPDGKVVSKSEGTMAPADGANPASDKEKEAKSPNVSVSTTVVGPDGKVVAQSGGKTIPFDLGKVIEEATAAAGLTTSESKAPGEAAGKAATSISGKVVVVGKDGKVTTQPLGDMANSEALQKALGAALAGIDVKVLKAGDSKVQTQVFGFGTPVIEGSDLSDRLSKIEKELNDHRQLLEKILKKL